MELFVNALFWMGIVGLIDGSLGLLFEEKWQRMTTQWNIQKVALIEIGIAATLVAVHFLLR